jgi:pyruvate formate lyase activating enzyme
VFTLFTLVDCEGSIGLREPLMKEAMLWKGDDGNALCHLCAHRCNIKEGERGLCGVRLNSEGTLYSLVYGKLISRAIDPIEKKPLYNFLPGTRSYSIATAGCNFFCDFCQNWQISQMSHKNGSIYGEDCTAEEIASDAKAHRCESISYTYTEPTIFFEFAYDTARIARRMGLKNVFVTNGYQTPETISKMAGVIDAANVDLKAYSDQFYKERCRARLAPVLKAIRLMYEKGIFVEVTTLIVPGENDSSDEIKQIADFVASVSPEIPWHVSRFHPQYRQSDKDWTPSDTIFDALETGKASGLKYVYAGNLPAGKYEHTYCPHCGELVVERSGFSSRSPGLSGNKCINCGEALNIIV